MNTKWIMTVFGFVSAATGFADVRTFESVSATGEYNHQKVIRCSLKMERNEPFYGDASYHDYSVEVEICTSEGCSNPLLIDRLAVHDDLKLPLEDGVFLVNDPSEQVRYRKGALQTVEVSHKGGNYFESDKTRATWSLIIDSNLEKPVQIRAKVQHKDRNLFTGYFFAIWHPMGNFDCRF